MPSSVVVAVRAAWNVNRQIEATIAELSEILPEQTGKLQVIFEPIPGDTLQGDDIKSDMLGVNIGVEFVDQNSLPMPPQSYCFSRIFGHSPGMTMKCFVLKIGQLFCMSWDIIWARTKTICPCEA